MLNCCTQKAKVIHPDLETRIETLGKEHKLSGREYSLEQFRRKPIANFVYISELDFLAADISLFFQLHFW
jgi:hypothetical protein